MIKRADWLAIGKDRAAIILLLTLAALVIVVGVTTVLRVHVSDIQLPVRFTGYGENNIYRDQWYTHLSYMGFALLLAGGNGFLAIKAYQVNRTLGLGFLGFSIFIMIVGLVIFNAILNLTPVL
jgi:hypothetical protein